MYAPLTYDEVEEAIGSGVVTPIPCKKTLFRWKKECDALARRKTQVGGLMLYMDPDREILPTIDE
jgi:hypothetical protein